jgi:hypothetical protein
MTVRMRALQQAVGPTESWDVGEEIQVSEEVAVKFERSGMAERIQAPKVAEVAVMKTPQNASRQSARGRNRA